jgi:hypothetical protein
VRRALVLFADADRDGGRTASSTATVTFVVGARQVSPGPWKRVVTTRQVYWP